MPPEDPEHLFPISEPNFRSEQLTTTKLPRLVLEGIFAFPPNRDTLGGTAYLILENSANILIDSPTWGEINQRFLQEQGGIQWLFITHRGNIGKAREIQATFGCEIVIQEQEAYLLPGLKVTSFGTEFNFSPQSTAIWTPGHSPGSSCLYNQRWGGVLFSGRHLLPNQQGEPVPLRTTKTFHWPRQIRSVQALRDRFRAETLAFICPGANTDFFRNKLYIERAYQGISKLDLNAYLQIKAIL